MSCNRAEREEIEKGEMIGTAQNNHIYMIFKDVVFLLHYVTPLKWETTITGNIFLRIFTQIIG